MIYADEDFYNEFYLLGRKPVISAGFLFYSRQASQLIDQHTFGRLKNVSEDELTEDVKMCCCELAESICVEERSRHQSSEKTSEKIGTYSVTYGDASAAVQTERIMQKQIINKWLGNTGLLYKGVR